MRRAATFGLAVGLVGAGLWLSSGLGTTQIWLFGAGLLGLLGISVESFLERPLAPESGNHYQSFTLWVAPGLLVVAGLWLMQLMSPDSQGATAAAMAALMGVQLLGLQAGLKPQGRFYRLGRFAGNLILYLVVFLLFALIYHTKERSLITATSTGVVALLAAVELFRPGQGKEGPGWRWAALVALVVAETTWAVNYWPVSGLVGGALLLLTFYVFAGLLVAMKEGGIDRRILVEYGTVSAAGLLAITLAML